MMSDLVSVEDKYLCMLVPTFPTVSTYTTRLGFELKKATYVSLPFSYRQNQMIYVGKDRDKTKAKGLNGKRGRV